VIELIEVLASDKKLFIVMELVTGGELYDLVMAKGRLSEATARAYVRQLVSGIAYCHEQGVSHRDLKPENLLLNGDGVLKISDFGLSAMAVPNELMQTTCGTPHYVAPEVLMDKGYHGEPADIWSVGVIIYVLLAGFLPFDEPTMAALFRKIVKADLSYPKWLSPSAICKYSRLSITVFLPYFCYWYCSRSFLFEY
jgi:serine/threonine protein kinase